MNKLNGRITKSATMSGALTRGAGGGTYVEANPEGEAAELLEKILIEDIIYNIKNLPSDSAADNGDVLTMGANGAEWAPLPETGINYSTNEQKIGTWIDGKKLYQKTIDLGAMPARGNSKSVAHNISDIDIIISGEAFGIDTSGSVIFIPNVSRGTVAAQTSISVDKTYINIYNGSSSDLTGGFNGYVTIKYTKVGE